MRRLRSQLQAPTTTPAVVDVPVPPHLQTPLVVVRELDVLWTLDAAGVSAWVAENAGAIVWAEAPPGFDAGWIVDALLRGGCAVRLVAQRAVDRTVPENVAEVAAPSAATIREVVAELCAARDVPATIRDAVTKYCGELLGEQGL